ncbi:glycoside hydrolase [Termitidicoccus mucosus]|uniref:exo-alpha-sialidase n=1 Tax=Termitidicoccus mucosus TaxID=1184151 RepID=A0A178IMB9_9BACT|nr:hypothetical protein AW736_05870 [Opitutaceae bacterium TSB47]
MNTQPIRISDDKKFQVSPGHYDGLVCPNPKGWYHSSAGVVATRGGALVACYRLSDNHCALYTSIMITRSEDKGRTWSSPFVLSHRNVWQHHEAWVAPQISRLRDGRIVVIADLGQRNPGQDWPMLSAWQKPARGMSNHLFWSDDDGRTWRGPRKIDDMGGEPSYITELHDGTLLYTRTDSAATSKLKNPPPPWLNIYYKNSAVFSTDGGETWGGVVSLADDPFHGDCEVGVVEHAPNQLLAVTRIGMGASFYGQPSRIVRSHNGGKTWDAPALLPVYAHRPCVRQLQSGKLLVTYRNAPGTPGNRAFVFDPDESLPYEPQAWIPEEERCRLGNSDELLITTDEGKQSAVSFIFYPAQDDTARVEISATLRVFSADLNGCNLGAGCWVRLTPDRVCLGDQPETGFNFDTTDWHDYRIVRENGVIAVFVDGVERLHAPVGDLWTRFVRVGNRVGGAGAIYEDQKNSIVDGYFRNASRTSWKAIHVKVTNPDTHSIDWQWRADSQTYPDQFRRDRVVELDLSFFADTGYSGWAQMDDGTIVIVDYTNGGCLDSHTWHHGGARNPFIRAYVLHEEDLVRSR